MYPNSRIYLSGVFVHEQVKELKKLGINVIVFAPVPLSPFPLNLISEKWKNYHEIPKYEYIDGVDIYHTRYIALPGGYLKRFWAYPYAFFVKKLLPKICNKRKIDLIHAHGSIPDDFAAMLLSKSLNIPFVLTVHGETVYYKKKQKELNKSIAAILSANAVIGVSQNVLNRIVKITKRQDNLYKVYNGFNIDQSSANLEIHNDYSKPENKVNILFGATLVERKGCEIIIKAFEIVSKEFENIYLTIAGGGELLEKMKKITLQLLLEKKVKFLGSVKNSEMLRQMQMCDIFVLPSWDEAFGVVYLEAMSFKKPIIGSVGEGISEIIEDGKNGFLVPPRNYNLLAEKLKLLIQDKELRIQTGIKGYESIKELTWENNAKKIIQVYQQITSLRD